MPLYYSGHYIAARYSFDTTRKSGWVAESLNTNPVPGVSILAPAMLTRAHLVRVLDEAYVDAVLTGQPRALAESNGFDWDPGMATAAVASVSGICAAAESSMRDRQHAGSLSSGLHHARRGAGSGFCTFNGLALAARAAISAGAMRILILDLDAHCGGGTHSLAMDWPEVWSVDVATSSFDAYELASGGRWSLDVIHEAARYLTTIQRRLDALGATSFDLCLYNAGMDCHEDSMGIRGITTDVLAERERLVFGWAESRVVPVAFCLAGGYTGPLLHRERLVELHRLTIARAAGDHRDGHADREAPTESRAVEHALETARAQRVR